jgi:hypothetical protein
LEPAPPDGTFSAHDVGAGRKPGAASSIRLALVIDGDAGRSGFQTLSFIGTKALTAPGQVRFFFEGNHTVVEVNTAGTGGAEMQLQLDGHVGLVAGDFLFADVV